MAQEAVIDRLTPRQGKVLRYIVSTSDQPVTPDRCVVTIEWSDLPRTITQARKALSDLKGFGLVDRVGKGEYVATDAGKQVLKTADAEHRWQQAPDRSVTNQFQHRKQDQQ